MGIFQEQFLGNRFEVLTDHKAITSALQSSGGNKSDQSLLTSWADRLLLFDFKVTHIAGTKLGVVDYLSRHPTFEAPQPSSFDKKFGVKSIQNFFTACTTVAKLYNKECNYEPNPKPIQFLPKITSLDHGCQYLHISTRGRQNFNQ